MHVVQFGTESKSTLPPFANPAKDGAPARAKTKLQSNLPEWYYDHRNTVNHGNHGHKRKGGPA